jgi:hypothetical protein
VGSEKRPPHGFVGILAIAQSRAEKKRDYTNLSLAKVFSLRSQTHGESEGSDFFVTVFDGTL